MDDHYLYVFVRQDLPLADQLVHSNHATYHLATLYRCGEGIPNLVVIGVPHLDAMKRVLRKLESNQVPHFAWNDPDSAELGITAIATAPLSPEQKRVMVNYRLWNYSPGAAQAVCGLTPDGGANLPS